MTSSKRLLLIIGSLFVIYICCESAQPLQALFGCTVVLALCIWLLIKYPVVISPSGNGRAMNGLQQAYYNSAVQAEKNNKVIVYMIGSLLAFFWMRFVIGSLSFSFFSFFDNAFRFSDDGSPLVSWMLIGLLVGAAAGAFVSGRKYRLPAVFKFLPALILVLMIVVFAMINKPFAPLKPVNQDVQLRGSVETPIRKVANRKPLKKRHKVFKKAAPIIASVDSLDNLKGEEPVDSVAQEQ